MVQTSIESIDNVDMAEFANGADIPLGTIVLEFGSVLDTDFEDEGHAVYVESDFLGMGGWYDTIESGLAAIAYCIAEQGDEYLSEFVIPSHGETTRFLIVTIGARPTENGTPSK